MTLQLYDHGEAVRRSGACCAGQDIYDAKTVADRLGIAHYVLDYESRFRDRRDRPVRRRICARPDAGALLAVQPGREVRRPDRLRARARRRLPGDRPLCAAGRATTAASSCTRARDPRRDQSYFLYGTTREQLDFLRFPLGDLPKDEVRRIAAEVGLRSPPSPTARTSASSPTAIMPAWSSGCGPRPTAPGEIVDLDGRVLGRHRGVVHFTVGQRRGIEIGGQNEPLYVVRIEPETRRLVVGPRRALAVEAMRVDGLELDRRGPARGRRQGALARAAGRRRAATAMGPLRRARIWRRARARRRCFYDGTRLLGGGWIAETQAADRERGGMPAAWPSSARRASTAAVRIILTA